MDIHTFDRAAVLAALEPPRFRDGETEYVGRILSVVDWFRLEERLLSAGDIDGLGAESMIQRVCHAMFPAPRWWEVWRSPWRPSVAALVASLPFATQLVVFQSFVRAQVVAHGTTPGQESKSPIPTSASS
jgi:hypothetical protein